MTIEYNDLKKKIEKEIKTLEGELKTVGRRNPSNPNDWEPVPATLNVDAADENEVAESIEEFEDNTGILKQLEIRYNELLMALEHINKGTFGICEVGGEHIEEDRLLANPAATTCKAHMEQ